MEKWHQIENWGYEITETGKIRNSKSKKELSQMDRGYGYLCVHLWKNNKMKTFDVHRLVAATFISNPDCKQQVNHKNGIKTDNRVENLEWVTHYENQQHSFLIALHRPKRPVLEIDDKGCILQRFESTVQASKITGLSQPNISLCCLGKRKFVKNRMFRYEK